MTRDPLGSRLRAVVVGTVPPYGDVGAVEIIAAPHPYLYCDPCGVRLYVGTTVQGAAVWTCRACERILDARRVS